MQYGQEGYTEGEEEEEEEQEEVEAEEGEEEEYGEMSEGGQQPDAMQHNHPEDGDGHYSDG